MWWRSGGWRPDRRRTSEAAAEAKARAAGANETQVADRLATAGQAATPAPFAPRGRIPKNATPKQRMARKLKTKKGRAAYARRKAVVEPVCPARSGPCKANTRSNAGWKPAAANGS